MNVLLVLVICFHSLLCDILVSMFVWTTHSKAVYFKLKLPNCGIFIRHALSPVRCTFSLSASWLKIDCFCAFLSPSSCYLLTVCSLHMRLDVILFWVYYCLLYDKIYLFLMTSCYSAVPVRWITITVHWVNHLSFKSPKWEAFQYWQCLWEKSVGLASTYILQSNVLGRELTCLLVYCKHFSEIN